MSGDSIACCTAACAACVATVCSLVGGVLVGDITFPREVARIDGIPATVVVVVVEVLGGTLLVTGAMLVRVGHRTDWICAMSVSLVPVVGTSTREQCHCS